jgi:hypothetical protein
MAARLQRDKSMFGDGFEWAVHEAIRGEEPTVVEPIAHAMKKASPRDFKGLDTPRSLLFGYERAVGDGGGRAVSCCTARVIVDA